MKPIHKMALAALLALSSAGLASATTTVVHVTGSTAYRVADVTAECSYLNSLGAGGVKAVSFGNVSSGTSTSSLTGANYSIIYGPVVSGNQTIFENYFNGSVAGDEALVDGVTTLQFPLASFYTSSAGAVTLGNSTTPASIPSAAQLGNYNGNFDTIAPDCTFSDVAFNTAQQIILNSTDHTTNTPAGTEVVGIVPFVFVCNGTTDVTSELANSNGSPKLSMDPQKFTYTWESAGSTELSFFTGNNADEATFVYPMGRDVDSGTRSTTLAETGYGLTGSGKITTPVVQYYPFVSQAADTSDQNTANANINNGFGATAGVIGADGTLSNPTIAIIDTVPQETIDGYTMDSGDGGYYSGGNMAKGVSTSFASGSINTVLMTYLGVSDATTALTASGTNRIAAALMAYNGITFYPYPVADSPTFGTNGAYPDGSTGGATGTNAAKIYEGQYTFWSYEHLFYKSSVSSAATGVGSLLNGGLDQLSSNNVTFVSMNVDRSGDGQNVQ